MNQDLRLRDVWQSRSLRQLLSRVEQDAIVITPYSDDEGVRNNKGRPGARLGPERIIHYLGRLVVHPPQPRVFILTDKIPRRSLAERHEIAETRFFQLIQKSYRIVSLGGGHDYAYPDASAFFRKTKNRILNVDAHLDVREQTSKINSGTAFRRFSERFGGRYIIQWGLQVHCNSRQHLQWAKSKKMKCLSYRQPWPKSKEALGLSICLDAFQGIRGVSAPSLLGPLPEVGLDIVRYYANRSRWLGIYESAPKLDPVTEDSARLGALLAYHFIMRGKLYQGEFL
jgi:formiminoglutamase